MSQAEGKGGMDFLSTHPGHDNRIEKLREFLPKVGDCFALNDNLFHPNYRHREYMMTVNARR